MNQRKNRFMNRKIKIAYIITSLGLGGAERVLFDLVSSLEPARFEAAVITVVDGGALAAKFGKLPIKLMVNHKQGKLGLSVLWKIYCQLRQFGPDIVHTHLFAGDVWGGLAAIFARVPVQVSTAHNTDMDESRLKKFVKRLVLLRASRAGRAVKIVAVSRAVKEYVTTVEKMPIDKVELIYNGVEAAKFFDPAPRLFSGDIPIIAIIARLARQKGHDVLFEALKLMKNQRFTVRVIGDGPLLAVLKQKAAGDERIRFEGDCEDVSDVLRQVDIVAGPSRWEGLGLSLIEAGLSGRVIVASRVGGIPEVVLDGVTGLLVSPEDPAALAGALDWLIEHPIEAGQMGRAAQRHCQKFGVDVMTENYCRLYESLTRAV